MRILAIGDIHGYLNPLQALIEHVSPGASDIVVFMGDYVDKGPNVKGTLDYLIDFTESQQSICLRGNHDQMLIDAYRDDAKFPIWECLAGANPLSGYGDGPLATILESVPNTHWNFLEGTCRNHFETNEFILVHGGIRPDKDPSQEDTEHLQWTTLSCADKHASGRTVVCGHTAQASGEIVDLGHTICVDTGITKGGWLSCLALDTFEFWQANAAGKIHSGKLR